MTKIRLAHKDQNKEGDWDAIELDSKRFIYETFY